MKQKLKVYRMTKITEAKTRQEIIDKRLLEAGWDVNNPSQVTSGT